MSSCSSWASLRFIRLWALTERSSCRVRQQYPFLCRLKEGGRLGRGGLEMGGGGVGTGNGANATASASVQNCWADNDSGQPGNSDFANSDFVPDDSNTNHVHSFTCVAST